MKGLRDLVFPCSRVTSAQRGEKHLFEKQRSSRGIEHSRVATWRASSTKSFFEVEAASHVHRRTSTTLSRYATIPVSNQKRKTHRLESAATKRNSGRQLQSMMTESDTFTAGEKSNQSTVLCRFSRSRTCAASEQRGKNSERFQNFLLKDKTGIWP